MAPSGEEEIIQQKLKELAGLVEQRDIIQAKIDKTEAAISAFIALLENEHKQEMYSAELKAATKPLGLTESIKQIFIRARCFGQSLDTVDVKEQLAESGFPISSYSNPIAVIYTTMMRLYKKGLIESLDTAKGTWRWTEDLKAMDEKITRRKIAPRSRKTIAERK